jgi:hypothetical protein
MAEYDKGRLYWIKLTDRFISSDTVDFLMSQKDGANYVVLYQMLCLKTVNNGGVLARALGEMIVPYDVEKIQRDCKWFSVDTVRIALELYKKLGLIYENNEGILAISDFDRLIGSQTCGAEKKALQRQRKWTEIAEGGQKVDNCPPEKDKEKDKEKEIHSFILSREEEKQKLLGGSLGGGVVMLSDEQFNSLCDQLSFEELNKYIAIVRDMELSGKKYKKKTHYQAILDMALKDRAVGKDKS